MGQDRQGRGTGVIIRRAFNASNSTWIIGRHRHPGPRKCRLGCRPGGAKGCAAAAAGMVVDRLLYRCPPRRRLGQCGVGYRPDPPASGARYRDPVRVAQDERFSRRLSSRVQLAGGLRRVRRRGAGELGPDRRRRAMRIGAVSGGSSAVPTNWLLTFAGRLGFAIDRALLYLKGGIAWANSEHVATQHEAAIISALGPTDGTASASCSAPASNMPLLRTGR